MEAIRYMVQNPKAHLWRPSLTLLVFEVLSQNKGDCQDERFSAALNIACGVEFLHTATLVVDDMIDKSHLRRGRPSCHIQFGNDIAQLVAVQLQNLSVMCFAQNMDLVLAQCASIEEMVSGEELDITNEDGETSDALHQKHVLKSQMIVLAAEAGAIIAGADGGKRKIVREYATALGFAYQCQDDLLDATGDEASLGKPIGQDIGKITAVSIFGERIHDVIKQHANLAKSVVCDIDVNGTLHAFTDIIIR
ncbi:MAG: polyprenyl synthetase family protein [bacterium]|nr:polyprenyl synthetase family protein [bacterium]